MTLAPFFTLALAVGAADAASIDKAKLADHIHKAYSTPAEMKLTVGDLGPSPVPGWLSGTLEVAGGPQKQGQPLLVSEDGRWYLLGAVVELKPSVVPGLLGVPEGQGLPPIQIMPGGKHAVVAVPKDLGADPDTDALSKLKLKDSVFSGPADAALTLVEFSDLQCPHCKRSQTILDEELPKSGFKVKRVFKHYPLDIHPWAMPAAIAATCVDKLKPAVSAKYRDRFFDAQETITLETVRAKAFDFAKADAVDVAALKKCMDSPEGKAAVEATRAEGDALGVAGTPSIFINGRRVRGYGWPEVKSVLDELSKK
ncbi:MAG: DSBA oxidoreductase [Elusimicrobia bacterium]|nr:MAG: DSBA oxidoreductase [Elusimicrobiota bacterium]